MSLIFSSRHGARRVLTACLGTGAAALVAMLLAGCDARSSASLGFPDDSQITDALRADFAEDPNNARARALIAQLGGDKGSLDYAVKRVVSRQGAFEAHYDVTLRMGQDGADSLSKLYGQMIPAEEAAKLPQQTLPEQEKWLRQQADGLQKTNPQEAEALRATLDALGPCYRDVKAGGRVPLMSGLAALLSPTRDGWYAERLQSPRVQLTCLPG